MSVAPPRRVLYKYLRKEHAHLLMNRGKFRIGTLLDYRKTAEHGNAIGDSTEGRTSLYQDVDHVTWTSDTQSDFSKSIVTVAPGAVSEFENCTFEQFTESPDF